MLMGHFKLFKGKKIEKTSSKGFFSLEQYLEKLENTKRLSTNFHCVYYNGIWGLLVFRMGNFRRGF